MIAMCGVGGPVRIGVMWSDDFNLTARFGNAMEFRNKSQYVGNMFYDMTADDFIELVVGEGIGQDTEIVYDVGMAARICVEAYGVRIFVLAATDIKDFLWSWRCSLWA